MSQNYYNVEDADIFHKFGYAVVDTSWVPLSFGGIFYAPATASTVRVKAGGNAADTAAGAGATAVTVYGIDQTGAIATSTLVTAGASASAASTETYLRVYRAVCRTSTYSTTVGVGSNTGAVTIETGGGTADILTIPAGFGQTQVSHYYVPAGRCLHTQKASFTLQRASGAAKTCEIRIMTRDNTLTNGTLTSSTGARCIGYLKVEDSVGHFPLEAADEDFRFLEHSEWWIEAKATGPMTVTFQMEGQLKTMGTRKRVEN